MLSVYFIQWCCFLFVFRLLAYASIRDTYLDQYKAAFGLPLIISVWTFFYWLIGSAVWFDLGDLQLYLALCPALALLLKVDRDFLNKCKKFFKENYIEQALFWLTILFTVYLRQHAPDLDTGEKYSDMALFQAVLLDTQFPPVDRWLSSYPLNYYYFSHLLFVPVVRIFDIPAHIAVNLITSTVPALMVSMAYAFLKQHKVKHSLAVLGAFFAFFAGNWEWMRWALGWSANQGLFWWWDSSRAIQNTITEFPYFSFLLGDMHAHYTSIAFVTLTFMMMWRLRQRFDRQENISKWVLYLVFPIILGMHYMMNSWHLPYMALLCVICFWPYPKYALSLFALATLYFSPFWLQYHPPRNTIGLFYVTEEMRSPLHEFLFHWGPMFFMLFMAFAQRIVAGKFSKIVQKTKRRAYIFILASIVLTLLASVLFGATPGFMAGVLSVFVILGYADELKNKWSAGVILLSLLTILGCEFISVDVTYGKLFYRMNTVFKFYYLAWWGLAIALPMLFHEEKLFEKKWAKLLMAIAVAFSLYYPIKSTYVRLQEQPYSKKTLDGLRQWSIVFPGHEEAIDWLQKNTHVQSVIWEMPGGGFSRYARMATFSGRPSVLGWLGHEQIWRDGGFFIANDRLQHFKKINQTPSMSAVQKFIDEYKVDWIIVGNLERKDYSPELLDLLSRFPTVFDNGDVVIYQARKQLSKKL